MRISDWSSDVCSSDIAGVDAQAGGAGVGGFQRALIVEMNVGDNRNLRRADDLAQRGGRIGVGAGNTDQVGARILAAAEDRKSGVEGKSVAVRVACGGSRIIKKNKTQ